MRFAATSQFLTVISLDGDLPNPGAKPLTLKKPTLYNALMI